MTIENWKIEGDYFESCNCDNICPCILLMSPTEVFCEAMVGWSIKKGHFNDVSLDGIKVGVWLHSPGDLTDGGWNLALYIDEEASQEQFDAIGALWSGEGGGHLSVIASLVSEVKSVKKAKISFESTDTKKHLVIEGVGENEMVPMEGGGGDHVVLHNPPLQVAPGFPIVVCSSVNAHYNDNGDSWKHTGKAGLASPFLYGPQN